MNDAGWMCEECGAPFPIDGLTVHHLFYMPGKDPWEYPHALLMCLCWPCHVRRQDIELTVFINVASVLRDKSADEIPSLPIHAFFDDCEPVRR